MRRTLAATIVVAALAAGPASAGGEIYGTVITSDGERLTGPIRWDSNENYWNDRLDARKTEVIEKADADEGFKFSLFGWEIINTKESNLIYHQLSVPFGHLSAVQSAGSNAAVLELKDGSKLSAEGSTSDLGRSLEIVVEDRDRGEVELAWRRIERVEFSSGPGKGKDGERLFGTVTTRAAGDITGFIIWDHDESLLDDVLDGEEGGEDREVLFRRIASIEPEGSSAAKVTLKSGEEMTLRGTNDVNDDMRGVLIAVERLGTIDVRWDELRKVVFSPAPDSPRYESFDGGKRLTGTVHASDGRSFAGAITWDMDETFTWESLDGELDRVEYAVLLANVRSIVPADERSAEVTLADGRSIRLSGSNDVDETNKGVMITTDDGTETVLDWATIERVEFN